MEDFQIDRSICSAPTMRLGLRPPKPDYYAVGIDLAYIHNPRSLGRESRKHSSKQAPKPNEAALFENQTTRSLESAFPATATALDEHNN